MVLGGAGLTEAGAARTQAGNPHSDQLGNYLHSGRGAQEKHVCPKDNLGCSTGNGEDPDN